MIEELKLILETVGSATDAGKTLVIWWFVLQMATLAVKFGTLWSIVYLVYRFAIRVGEWIQEEEKNNVLASELREIVMPNILGGVNDYERKKIKEALIKAKEE